MQKYNHLFVTIPGLPGYEINLSGEVWSHRSGGLIAGCISDQGYQQMNLQLQGGIRGRWCGGIHRLLAIAFLGLDITSKLQADHRDEDKGNNDISNLRIASRTENNRNVSMRRTNTSGNQGVSWHKASGKWQAIISFCGKNHHLGLFDNLNDAAAARKAAEVKYFGTFRPGYSADQPTTEEAAL